jgi:hypothetical protein
MASSAISPIKPPKASISRTKIPFPYFKKQVPTPPMDGLQDISPIVENFCVISKVFEFILAEAAAASHPACPPPMTITSNVENFLLILDIFERNFFIFTKITNTNFILQRIFKSFKRTIR